VVTQLADAGGKLLIIGGHGAAVSKATQVFLDDEAQTNGVAELSDGEAVALGPDALRAVFDHEQVMGLGDPRDLRHVRREPIQMHGTMARVFDVIAASILVTSILRFSDRSPRTPG